MKWTSNAKWTKISNSSDTHNTRAQAQGVCNMLEDNYSERTPCSIRGVCLMAWVEREER